MAEKVFDTQEERAYHALKQMISTGVLLPGARLVERELAQKLDMSRTPVRAAIRRLAQQGLITLSIQRGAKVRSASIERACEVLVVREALDGIAARLSAQSDAREALVRSLTHLLDQSREVVANHWFFDYSEISEAFHRKIYEACGNQALRESIERLDVQVVRFYFSTYLTAERLQASHKEHIAIASAIASGDADLAEEEARRHVRAVYSYIARLPDRTKGMVSSFA